MSAAGESNPLGKSSHRSRTSGAASGKKSAVPPRRAATADELVERVHAKVGHDSDLSLTDHLSAGRLLCRLRDDLVRAERPTSRGAIKLLACGIALHRRFAVGECGSIDVGLQAGPVDDQARQEGLDESRDLVRATASRLFALLCTLEVDRRMAQLERGMQGLDVDEESRRAVATVGMRSLWETIRDPPPRRKRQRRPGSDGEATAANEGDADDEEGVDHRDKEPDEEPDEETTTPSWESVLRASSGDVARHALRIGASCLEDESWKALESIMPLFFRHSAFNMAESLLMPDGDVDHLSLGAAGALAALGDDQRKKKLLSIAQAGESEAGQQAHLTASSVIRTYFRCCLRQTFHRRPPAAFPVADPFRHHPDPFPSPPLLAGHARPHVELAAAGVPRGRAAHAAAQPRGEHAGGRRPSDARVARARRGVRSLPFKPFSYTQYRFARVCAQKRGSCLDPRF